MLLNTKLEAITSMYKLREHYRTFDVVVDWLVTVHRDIQRPDGHRYTGTLMEVLKQMEVDFEVGLVDGMEPHVEAPDQLNLLIEHNGCVEHFVVFDLKNNRRVM
ncbi:hypothetical protein D3C87_1283530 [compost metagenome]